MRPEVALLFLAVPLIHALVIARRQTTARFLFNGGQTGFANTLGSAIAGNIGIGTFVPLFLFAAEAPLIAYALTMTYALGLLICAALAPRIHRESRSAGCFGLIDFLRVQHGITNRLWVWLPFAIVFGLRSLVQLLALSLILQMLFGLGPEASLGLAVAAVAAYATLGGYQAATQTDFLQAVVLVAGVSVIMLVLISGEMTQRPQGLGFLDLGPYSPVFLLAIMILFPFSTVLSVDNWQRIATSDTAANARLAYLVAATICGLINLTMAYLGHMSEAAAGTEPAAVLRGLRNVMPLGWGWISDALLLVAVMSSIDTFTMPLVGGLIGRGQSLHVARLATLGYFTALGLVALLLGDLLLGVIAAFSSLVVFLPSIFGALFLKDCAPQATLWSMGLGVAVTLSLAPVFPQAAALAGFGLSLAIYTVLRRATVPSSLPQ